MATRQEIARRRARLAHDLREGCRLGEWAPGEAVPSLGALVKRYEVSAPVVHEEIRKLVEEGVLYTVSRVGTFVNALAAPVEPFLFLRQDGSPQMSPENRARRGFEQEIAARGGAVLTLFASEASEDFERGELPMVAGVFEIIHSRIRRVLAQAGTAAVCFGEASHAAPHSDSIQFDDVDGGRKATNHLLRLGHTRIAFVGLHGHDGSGIFRWSYERQQGWRAAMGEAGHPTEELSFHPAILPEFGEQDQARVASEVAAPLVHCTDVTAVVAANSYTARGVLHALKTAKVPAANWPALVCFDEIEGLDDHIISALSLSWEEVGRQSAELLWRRATGQLSGAGQQRLVPMKLIPRLSCRPDWAQNTRVLQRHAAGNGLSAVPA